MVVTRPLRKTKLDGTPYYRREGVEAEIRELATLSGIELEHRTALWPNTTPGFVSPEALVHFVRNLPDGALRDKLTEQVLGRVVRRVPRPFESSATRLGAPIKRNAPIWRGSHAVPGPRKGRP